MSNQYTSTQWPCGSVVERLPSKQKVPGSSPGGAYFLRLISHTLLGHSTDLNCSSRVRSQKRLHNLHLFHRKIQLQL